MYYVSENHRHDKGMGIREQAAHLSLPGASNGGGGVGFSTGTTTEAKGVGHGAVLFES
jgi:hypothetical protein